jgi:hypothetical protein
MASAAVALLAGMIWPSGDAEAYPTFRRLFDAQYNQRGRCAVCHNGDSETLRNQYGKSWEDAGADAAAFKAIEKKDSDRDGVSNLDEIKGGSNPGNATSTPTNPGVGFHSPGSIPIPIEELSHVLGAVDRIEPVEIELGPSKVGDIEALAGKKLIAEERYPIFYFAHQGGTRAKVASFVFPRVRKSKLTLMASWDMEGRISRLAVLKAEHTTPQALRPILNCLLGRQRKNLPAPGRDGCSPAGGLAAEHNAIVAALRTSLETYALFFPPEAATAGKETK